MNDEVSRGAFSASGNPQRGISRTARDRADQGRCGASRRLWRDDARTPARLGPRARDPAPALLGHARRPSRPAPVAGPRPARRWPSSSRALAAVESGSSDEPVATPKPARSEARAAEAADAEARRGRSSRSRRSRCRSSRMPTLRLPELKAKPQSAAPARAVKLPVPEPRRAAAWRVASIPLAAAAVIGGLLLIQGDGPTLEPHASRRRAGCRPPPPTSGAANARRRRRRQADRQGRRREATTAPSSSAARPTRSRCPPGWEQIDSAGRRHLRRRRRRRRRRRAALDQRGPEARLPHFINQSLTQLETLAGSAQIVERIPGPTPRTTVVRLAADAPAGEPSYEVTLRAAGPYRYYLATTVQPDASREAVAGIELISGSFTPEGEGCACPRESAPAAGAAGARRAAAGLALSDEGRRRGRARPSPRSRSRPRSTPAACSTRRSSASSRSPSPRFPTRPATPPRSPAPTARSPTSAPSAPAAPRSAVPYVGNGSYGVRVTAYGPPEEPGRRGEEVIATDVSRVRRATTRSRGRRQAEPTRETTRGRGPRRRRGDGEGSDGARRTETAAQPTGDPAGRADLRAAGRRAGAAARPRPPPGGLDPENPDEDADGGSTPTSAAAPVARAPPQPLRSAGRRPPAQPPAAAGRRAGRSADGAAAIGLTTIGAMSTATARRPLRRRSRVRRLGARSSC